MKPKFDFLKRAMLASLIFASSTALLEVSAATTSAAVVPQVNLCSVTNQVTSLRVSRGIPYNPTTFSFPRLVFVKRALSAQTVAAALCALPAMPTGLLSCPASTGSTYSLLFSMPGYYVTDIRLQATGCQGVSGLGAERWIERSPNFYRILGTVMELKHPTLSTFWGTLKPS